MRKGSDVDKIALLYTTWPDAETAERAAEAAVEARLAACVNILGSGRSIYRWRGAIERTEEVVALFKTIVQKSADLTQLIIEHHPNETPAILSIETAQTGSNPEFLDWIRQEAS